MAATQTRQVYDEHTALKGGYRIVFTTDDDMQYLYLKKGTWKKELTSCSKGLPERNLGYLLVDFTGYFVLAHSYGTGNPTYMELIRKATGKNALPDATAYIGSDEKQELLLYSDNEVPAPEDSMTLLNIRTFQKRSFPFPADIFGAPEILNRIHLLKAGPHSLTIEYEVANQSKTKVYRW